MIKTLTYLTLAGFLTMLLFAGSVNASNLVIMQGWLISKDCLDRGQLPCVLEEFFEDALILYTIDEKAYRIQANGVEDWKLQKAYGQLIGLKGLMEGDSIMVSNIVQITGDKKLTKACK